MSKPFTSLIPLATRIKTDFEVDFANFMMKNSGLLAGTVGQGAKTWDEIAEAHQLMYENKLHGTVACLVGAPRAGLKNLEETLAATANG